MTLVERIRGAEREADPMQGQRIMRPNALETLDARSARGKVVFRVCLEPCDRRRPVPQFAVVLRAQADAGCSRH